MERARLEQKDGSIGLQLPALIRNVLLADCGCDWEHACKVAAMIERAIQDADWVSLDNGDTLELLQDPPPGR